MKSRSTVRDTTHCVGHRTDRFPALPGHHGRAGFWSLTAPLLYRQTGARALRIKGLLVVQVASGLGTRRL